MALAGEDSRGNYAEVELAANPSAGSSFFIDSASCWSLFRASAMLTGFFVMHLYAALQAPPVFSRNHEFFPVNKTAGTSKNVDITISELQSLHRFVAVNCSLVADSTVRGRVLPITVNVRRVLLLNLAVKSEADFTIARDLHFVSGSSESFEVAHIPVSGIDTLQLRLSLQASYSGISGFQFHWTFVNPITDRYRNSVNLLLSFLMGYTLVVFALYLEFDSESFTQFFMLALGLLGVAAANPLNLLLPEPATPRMADSLLMALFTAVYRMFLLIELELLRSRSASPNAVFLIVLGMFFCFYATVDAVAMFDRQSQLMCAEAEGPVVFPTETMVMWTHAAYVGVSLLYLLVAVAMNDAATVRRLWFFGLSVVVTGAVTVVTQIVFVVQNWFMYSVVPTMAFASVHVMFAAMTVFLLHSGGEPEYKDLVDEGGGHEAKNIALGIEQASDLLDSGQGFAEESVNL
jgi:hypothetical protein